MVLEFVMTARGSPDILATDPVKIVITKIAKVWDDSVIGVSSSAAASNLPAELRAAIGERKKVRLVIECSGEREEVRAFGHYNLKCTNARDIVLTKADFYDPAVIGVKANKAAADLDRVLVKAMQMKGEEIKLTLRVTE